MEALDAQETVSFRTRVGVFRVLMGEICGWRCRTRVILFYLMKVDHEIGYLGRMDIQASDEYPKCKTSYMHS